MMNATFKKLMKHGSHVVIGIVVIALGTMCITTFLIYILLIVFL